MTGVESALNHPIAKENGGPMWTTSLFDQFRATAHASLCASNAHDLLPAVSTLAG